MTMEAFNASQFFCPRCSAEVAAAAPICPRCGAVLAPAGSPPAPAGERSNLLDNPWMVLALLFLATGALGLPILWKSRAYSPGAKVLIGVAVTIYTVLLIALAAWAVHWAWRAAQTAL